MNPALTADFEQDQEIIERIDDLNWGEHGYAMIRFGEDAKANGTWPGHLVTIVPEVFGNRAAILDPTIPQVNSQGHGFALRPILVGVPNGFLEGQQSCGKAIESCFVLYHALPDDRSYEQTPLWEDRQKQKRISRAVLDRLQ
jgi:hypothetical protein